MRILLALIVIAGAVIALLLLLSERGVPAEVGPDATRRADAAQVAPSELGSATNCVELDSADRMPAYSEPGSPGNDPSLDATAQTGDGCRVEIVLLGSRGLLDEAVDVECTDSLGSALRIDSTSVSTWVIANVPPGEYHVASVPRSWQSLDADPAVSRLRSTPPFVTERFQVLPGERSKRVELTLRNSREVRVRWQSLDGQPIAVALPGILRVSASLHVFVTRQRLAPGESVAWLQPAWRRFVSPDSIRVEAPAWPDAPADGFARIPIPEEGVWYVQACIERTVVESVAIVAGTEEIVVRTDVDLVRRWKTRLKFCVVAAETQQPVAGASYTVSFEARPMPVSPNGCVVEERFLPGTWLLAVEAPGRAPHVREIMLPSGRDLDLGTIALVKSCSVLVRVLAPDGTPAAGVDLALVPIARFATGRDAQRSGYRDKNLIFSVGDEPHALLAQHATWAARPLRVEGCGATGGDQEVTLQLEEGTAVALDYGPDARAEPQVLVTTADGLPAARGTIGRTGLAWMRLASGDYVVTRPGVAGRGTFRVGATSLVVDLR